MNDIRAPELIVSGPAEGVLHKGVTISPVQSKVYVPCPAPSLAADEYEFFEWTATVIVKPGYRIKKAGYTFYVDKVDHVSKVTCDTPSGPIKSECVGEGQGGSWPEQYPITENYEEFCNHKFEVTGTCGYWADHCDLDCTMYGGHRCAQGGLSRERKEYYSNITVVIERLPEVNVYVRFISANIGDDGVGKKWGSIRQEDFIIPLYPADSVNMNILACPVSGYGFYGWGRDYDPLPRSFVDISDAQKCCTTMTLKVPECYRSGAITVSVYAYFNKRYWSEHILHRGEGGVNMILANSSGKILRDGDPPDEEDS